MNAQSHHGDRHVLEGYATRALDSDFPELRAFLSPGLDVLDVGCGPGTITLDVAAIVTPGNVVGLDDSRAAVTSARERAEAAGADHLEFVVGDAYGLPFEGGRFDVVYSHALMSWLRDPVRALSEQRRAVRPSGWVVHPVGDLGTRTMFPPCPNLDTVFESWRNWSDRSTDAFVQDGWIARDMVAYMRQAGFSHIETSGRLVAYRSLKGLNKVLLNPNGSLQSAYAALFRSGALAEATVQAARDELAAWQADPSRYFFQTTVLFAARP